MSKVEALDDEEYRDLYLTFDQAFDWSPADPRLRELAAAMLAYVARIDPDTAKADEGDPFQAAQVADETLAALLKSQTEVSPAWERLTELLDEERRG